MSFSRRTLFVLFIVGFFAYAFNNAFMITMPSYILEFGGSNTEAGVQGTVFIFFAIFLRFFCGPLADRYGEKPLMLIGLFAFAVSAALLPLDHSFWYVLFIRIIQSVGLAAYFPCATSFVSGVSKENSAGSALGWYRAIASLSLLFGPSLLFSIIDWSSYNIGFYISAATMLVSLILLAILLPKSPRILLAKETNGSSSYNLPKSLSIMDSQKAASDRHFRTLRQDPYWFVVFIVCPTFFVALGYGLITSFSAIFIETRFPTLNPGIYASIMGIGGLITNPLIGTISDRVDRRLLLCSSLAINSLGFLLSAISSASIVLALSAALCGIGYYGAITVVLTMIAARTALNVRPKIMAYQQNALDLGIALAGSFYGILLDLGIVFSALFVVQATIIGTSLVLLLLAKRDRNTIN